MKARKYTIPLAGLICLYLIGCTPKTPAQTATKKIPWTRVNQVEVTSDTEAQSQPATPHVDPVVAPGASQSQVIIAWGQPDYIIDSPSDPKRRIWQYPHAVVVFQGTKVQKVLPR